MNHFGFFEYFGVVQLLEELPRLVLVLLKPLHIWLLNDMPKYTVNVKNFKYYIKANQQSNF